MQKIVIPIGSGFYNYVYHLKEHLGNIRVSFTKQLTNNTAKLLKENHYYPFGLKHPYNSTEFDIYYNTMTSTLSIGAMTNSNRYQYNNKEWQNELSLNLYDYGARMFDPAIGRWGVVDPLAEKYQSWSPYNYVLNNPISNIDPDGMEVETDFLNTQTGQTLHVEDGKDQIALVNDQHFKQVKTLASATSWNREQTEQYENLSSANVHSMDSDLGILSRLTYSEMAQGNDNSKAIVAESAVNRTELPLSAYENVDGTLSGAINLKGAYDVTSGRSIRNDEFLNPFTAREDVDPSNKVVMRRSFNQKEWGSSIKAAFNAINGSDIGKGTIFYHSENAAHLDNKSGYQKVNLNINHKGILGTWKLK